MTASEHTAGLQSVGSQSQTRTSILGAGTAFDAQKQFLTLIEEAIMSPVDLPSQIARYQNLLKYARSKVDFVYGIGLYMSPSNMALRIGTIQDYNNQIVIANEGEGLTLGLNDEANTNSTKINFHSRRNQIIPRTSPNTFIPQTSTRLCKNAQPPSKLGR